eukprot:COSAG02_NODE_380_length_23483_cov_8.034382_16_plen_51_part_00
MHLRLRAWFAEILCAHGIHTSSAVAPLCLSCLFGNAASLTTTNIRGSVLL